MKATSYLLLACLVARATALEAAQTAQVRLYCISVRLATGTDEWGDKLTVTSTGSLDAGVGDLAASQPIGIDLSLPGTDSYVSNISLYDPQVGETSGGIINISIDAPTDDNNNRHADFFEVAKAVNAIRPFGMIDIYGYGRVYNVAASWSRSPGSPTGNCVIAIDDGYWGTFHHTFEIMEYTGTLTYIPGKTNVSGTLNLTKTGDPSKSIQANLQFVKSDTDRFNQLSLLPGSITGTQLSTLNSFTNHIFTRDTSWPTNYAGYVEFSDGDPFTFEPYANWVLSITDTNDSNGDGIPDFSDDPSTISPPRAARLSMSVVNGALQLTIQGDVNRQYEIQGTISLATTWQSVQTVTLSSDPQTVTLPLPTGTKFWRVIGH